MQMSYLETVIILIVRHLNLLLNIFTIFCSASYQHNLTV